VRFPGRVFIETEVVSQVALFRREPVASAHRSFSLAEGMLDPLCRSARRAAASQRACPSTADVQKESTPFLSTLSIWRTGGLAARPESCLRVADVGKDPVAEARTFRNGRSEMLVLLSTYGSRGDVEPMVGLAVQMGTLGAEVRMCAPPVRPQRTAESVAAKFDTVAAAAEECDAPVATDVMPTGGW
jgi:hypothetical protein